MTWSSASWNTPTPRPEAACSTYRAMTSCSPAWSRSTSARGRARSVPTGHRAGGGGARRHHGPALPGGQGLALVSGIRLSAPGEKDIEIDPAESRHWTTFPLRFSGSPDQDVYETILGRFGSRFMVNPPLSSWAETVAPGHVDGGPLRAGAGLP